MEGIKRFLVVSIFVILQLLPIASASTSLEGASQHPIWLSLLHYEKPLVGSASSAIKTSDFFYSDNGSFNAHAELIATLAAFQNSPDEQCKFPARSLFISEYVQPLPEVKCAQFDDFISSIRATDVSLVYASGYLGNPASMYGHVFLKFNNAKQSDLLDNTYNYGARYPEDEHPVAYIFNGIFGGYNGFFANQKYHHQTLTYTESELRDLWEYSLAFSNEDIALLLAHLWELEQVPMTYYFFKQNCAYQIAQLLTLVTGKSYLPKHKPWVMPFDIVTAIEEHHPALIKAVKYHPSRQETLYKRFEQLNSEERAALIQALESEQGSLTSLDRALSPLNEEQKKRVIDTAFDYFSYLSQAQNSDTNSTLQQQREVFVTARFKLPPGQSKFATIKPIPPHHAQDTTLLQVGVINNNHAGTRATFRFRANYYDLLTINPARIPFSELSTFDMKLHVDDDRIHLAELTALRITNLNAAHTGLPSDNKLAWKLATGYRDLSVEDMSGSLYIDGLAGKSYSPTANIALYGGLSSTITSKDNLGGYLAIGAELGGVTHISPHYAMSFSVGHQRYVNAPEQKRTYARWEQRFLHNQQYDVRALLRYDEGVEYSISLSHYF